MELLFVGLGNYGNEYAHNRHNVGFMVIDALAQHFGFSFNNKFSSLLAQHTFKETKIIFQKPQTYMNLSGNAVLQAHMFYKIPHKHIFVFYDDLDLETGRIKVKLAGGSNGHNGIKSIDGVIGTNYHRVRIGIGRPKHGDVSNYVLSNFTTTEQDLINKSIESIISNISYLLAFDLAKFMSYCALAYQQSTTGE